MAGDGDLLIINLTAEEKAATDDRTIQQSLEIIRRRVDEVGTADAALGAFTGRAILDFLEARFGRERFDT